MIWANLEGVVETRLKINIGMYWSRPGLLEGFGVDNEGHLKTV